MRFRWLVAVALCALGALTLTGCDSKIGTAAEVNGSKISESDVARYLDPAAESASQARNLALQYQIREKLFNTALQRKHAVPSDADLRQLHDVAVSNLLGQQLSGADADQKLHAAMAQNGLKESFADVLTRSFELELYYAKQINANQESAVISDLDKQKIPVQVNPRFGSWDTSTFAFTGLGSKQLPSVVTLNGNPLPGDAKATTSQ
ncbi:MAG: hypothetical protein ACJ74U_17960 [Jatrophihabitantaceae bacterium]